MYNIAHGGAVCTCIILHIGSCMYMYNIALYVDVYKLHMGELYVCMYVCMYVCTM